MSDDVVQLHVDAVDDMLATHATSGPTGAPHCACCTAAIRGGWADFRRDVPWLAQPAPSSPAGQPCGKENLRMKFIKFIIKLP